MKKIIFSAVVALVLTSCNREIVTTENVENQLFDKSFYTRSNKFETNPKERVRNAILELTDLQKTIDNNIDARQELAFLLNNKYYVDNYVGLIDILYPNESEELYSKSQVPSNLKGEYSKAFFNELKNRRENYPNLSYIVNQKKNVQSATKSTDFNLSFYDLATIQFYAPYIDDINDIEFDPTSEPTYVPGVLDANAGLGYKNVNNNWTEVNVDDAYALSNRTIIIEPNSLTPCGGVQPILTSNSDGLKNPCFAYAGGGISAPTTSAPVNTPTYNPDCLRLSNQTSNGWIREVKWGHGRLKHQYDAFISFTGNGGGSELMLCRKGSKDNLEVDSTGNFNTGQWDVVKDVYFTRKEIRKQTEKWLAVNWDTNWECNTGLYEQTMCVWEADTEGNVTASGSLKFKKDDLLNFNYNIGNRSKDQLINHDKWDVNWFFATAFNDQGCGMKQGLGVYSDKAWPWRECGANFNYTMVYKAFYVGNNSNY